LEKKTTLLWFNLPDAWGIMTSFFENFKKRF